MPVKKAKEERSEEIKDKKPSTKKEVKQKKAKKESTFYMGPTIKIGILENGAIFRGGLSKEVEGLKKKYPAMAPLFVSKKEYTEACKKLRDPASRLSLLYKTVLDSIRGGK